MTSLTTPVDLGPLRLKNRLYRAPVLEGAGSADDPAAVYAKHFVPNAEAGVGLIVQGNTIVTPEGRTSPGMGVVTDEASLLRLAPMVSAVHKAGAKIVIQLGHGGIFAIESWHKDFAAKARRPLLAASPPPFWMRALGVKAEVLSSEAVEALARRFGEVAAWARKAGYDGVQLAGSNAKLLHQFLSPTFNKRDDRYGGSVRARAQILVDIRRAIRDAAGADFPVLLKYTAIEEGFGKDTMALAEGLEIARIAEAEGFAAVTPVAADAAPNTAICRGEFPLASFKNKRIRQAYARATGTRAGVLLAALPMFLAARRFPFEPAWNEPVFAAVRRAVSIPVFGVGGIRSPEQANGLLKNGACDVIGVGRPFYAEPDLARRFLASEAETAPAYACENCNRCVPAQMLGLPGVCYNPAVNARKRLA